MRYVTLAIVITLSASSAHAQLPGGLTRRIGQAQEAKKKLDDLHFSDREERQLGEHISGRLIERFGVYQDVAVTRYVSLVGTILAQGSSRPNLRWEFIVLDTDGVNAYAAPGGLIHITRGALGLMRTEAELAGVLGHEVAHVIEKHTVDAIRKAHATELGTEFAARQSGDSGLTTEAVQRLGNAGYDVLFQGRLDRGDEMESDKAGAALAHGSGYAPAGMIGFLTKVGERNKDMKEPNGLFASHPQIRERISAIEKAIREQKLTATATVSGRYTGTITFEAKPASAIAMDIPGVRGAVGDSAAAPSTASGDGNAQKPAPPKKSGGLLGGIGSLTKGSQTKNSQTVASAGSRGGVPDRDATGGANKNKVRVTISASDLAEFRKGIS